LLPILLAIFLMMISRSRRLRHRFVQLRARCDQRPIRHGEEKSSPGYSSIGHAVAAQLIPMLWN
jgi:hypothetical protein